MFEIEKGVKKLNGEVVETYKRTVNTPSVRLAVEAGTTGYKGSASRLAGGRTYIRIVCHKGDFCFDPFFDDEGTVIGFEIGACGDAALDAIMKAFAFAQEAINDQRCDADD